MDRVLVFALLILAIVGVSGFLLHAAYSYTDEYLVVRAEFVVPQWNSLARIDLCPGVYFIHDHPQYGVQDGVYVHGSYHPLRGERIYDSRYNVTIVFQVRGNQLYYNDQFACSLSQFSPQANDNVLSLEVSQAYSPPAATPGGGGNGDSPAKAALLGVGIVILIAFLVIRRW